ncbi:MAG: hypothetical protein AB7E60_11675 [Sphingobium sp.]
MITMLSPNPHMQMLSFTPRLVEGPTSAPRVVFLDPAPYSRESVEGRISETLDQYGEAVFAINRYGLLQANQRLGISRQFWELQAYGAPHVIHGLGRPVHTVFAATFPPPWDTAQVQSYAQSSSSPTIRAGIRAHQWLAELGSSASNRLLWSDYASC